MKKQTIVVLSTVLILAIALGLTVWLVRGVLSSVQRTFAVDAEVAEFSPWAEPTPDADISADSFYDEPSPVAEPADGADVPMPEEMIAVPVIETPEELAQDEAP